MADLTVDERDQVLEDNPAGLVDEITPVMDGTSPDVVMGTDPTSTGYEADVDLAAARVEASGLFRDERQGNVTVARDRTAAPVPNTTPETVEDRRAGGATKCPQPSGKPDMPRREVHSKPLIEHMDLIGAAVASIAFTTLLFGWVAPFAGGVGFVALAFLVFLGFYTLLVRLNSSWPDARDRVMTVLFGSAGVVLFGALAFIVVFTLFRGAGPLGHLNFFTQTMELAGPLDPMTMGGVRHAILGTLIQISIAIVISVPLGIATAVFLNEVGGRFARFVRTVADAMTALPSIVAGLFVYAAIIQGVTHEKSGFAASLAITVMMLPIIIRSSDVVLRLVPGNLREASYGLGASRWRTVWTVVLPTARSGLTTAVILGTARGIGETSPVLLTSGSTPGMNLNPFEGPMISLPLQVFDLVRSPEPGYIARGFGAAAALLAVVLVLFLVARILGGRAPGDLSERQQRAARAQSRKMLSRYESSTGSPSTAVVPKPAEVS